MFEGTDPLNAYKFVSSIGNINTYNGYTAIFYGVVAVAFMLSTTKYENIFSFVMLLIVTIAHIMGKSDNAILSTAAVWLVIPLLFIKNWSQVSKFFTVILVFIASLKGIDMISSIGIPTINDVNPSTIIAMGDKGIVTVLLILVLPAAVAAGYYGAKRRELSDKVLNRLKKAWIALIVIGFITVIIILVLANKGVHPEIWEPYKNILIFNDEWGTFRGLNWRLAMEYWNNDANLFAKIFGYGPDTYYIITMDRFFDLMYWNDYGYFDSVHNEYLEYMLTVGIAGFIAYVVFLSTAIKEMLSGHENGGKMVAIGVLAYAVQAVVNIAIAITTPVLMVLMFVGVVASRLKNKSNNE
ncbi:MAG: O-antigen ligase family protein [Oribacterium sp.]|nr:O-antigen ligase family protein [Oribacterium sp.]